MKKKKKIQAYFCVETSGNMWPNLPMTAATSRDKMGPGGREDFHFTYFEKEKKVMIGWWMIFIFYFGLFCIS